jgi:NADH-quinone oxidoreductase E subunit
MAMWTESEQNELDEILKKYPTRRSAILPALYLAQQEKNWLDEDDITAVATALDLNPTHVHAIVGFYTLLRKEPTGKYIIQVCTDLPCALQGADEFYRRLCQRLGLVDGRGSSGDNLFTIEPVVCLAACDKAPCAQINLEYCENLTDDKIDQIIAKLRQEAQADS